MAVGSNGPNDLLKADKSMSIFYNIINIVQICEMLDRSTSVSLLK